MKIENLTPEDSKRVESVLSMLSAANPSLSWFTYPMMGDPIGPPVAPTSVPEDLTGLDRNPTIKQLEELKEAVDALNRKIDLTFGGHVLVDGRFIKVT